MTSTDYPRTAATDRILELEAQVEELNTALNFARLERDGTRIQRDRAQGELEADKVEHADALSAVEGALVDAREELKVEHGRLLEARGAASAFQQLSVATAKERDGKHAALVNARFEAAFEREGRLRAEREYRELVNDPAALRAMLERRVEELR